MVFMQHRMRHAYWKGYRSSYIYYGVQASHHEQQVWAEQVVLLKWSKKTVRGNLGRLAGMNLMS